METLGPAESILSLHQAAQALSVSLATLRRAIARGDGPPVVRLSLRRVGIRTSALRTWLDEQTIDALEA